MSNEERERRELHFALRLGFDIAKVLLKGAMVAAAFCAVKEVHKVHKAIEARKEK